jgi:type IV pilus assembly protein PilY1
MKVTTLRMASMLALGSLLGVTDVAQSTPIADLPLKASVAAKPNVIIGFDDSGSMDAELMLNSNDGVFWWDHSNGTGVDAGGKLHRRIGGGTNDQWRRYFYLFPNGQAAAGGGLNVKALADDGDYAAPPTSDLAFLRSSDWNPQYYNPAVNYQPWGAAHTYPASTFPAATPTAARGHPLYGGATNTFDLTAVRALNENANRYFIALKGMTLPAGARKWECNNGSANTCGGGWTNVGATDAAARADRTTRLAMAYWPATYWVKAVGVYACTVPAIRSVGTDDCAPAPDGSTLKRIEIRSTVASYPSGRSYAAELQNFANWFQYHRKRRLATNAAMSEVLENINGLNLGVLLMGNNNQAVGTRIPLFDLNATASADNGLAILKSIYEIDSNLGTPTRETLNRIGQEFIDTSRVAAQRPVKYACQRNAALIVTDGYAQTGSVTPAIPAYLNTKHGSNVAPYATTHAGTLADIALSFYLNPLRPDSAAFPLGKVRTSATDPNPDLHMNTYAITLGAKGNLYDGEDTPRPTATSAWVNPTASFDPVAVDDLWHATINGRGQFYLATSADETAAKLRDAFNAIRASAGAQGGVAVSTVNLSRGDARAYFGGYDLAGWTGDLSAEKTNTATGAVIPGEGWSASKKLAQRDWTTRVIATAVGSSGLAFTAANVGATVNPGAVYGSNAAVIDYLRGDRSGEPDVFRSRANLPEQVAAKGAFSLMGAIINSEPAVAREDKVVYVASGEGMLHAFDTTAGADEGKELWAFVPPQVLPNIGRTVERGYIFRTQLDGSPVVGKTGATQKLLVAGMGAAGRGYYALDVSNPRGLGEAGLASKWKWQFPAAGDATMQAKVGQTLGRPVIVKTEDHGYVVLVTSGYNSTADGKGRMWMLNADTGALIAGKEFTVDAGTLGAESGLAQVAAFAESNGTVRYVYGGDLLGNLWRFDLKGAGVPPAPFKVATLVGPGGAAQPVTAAPELLFTGGKRIIVVGTGRLLDFSDFGNANVQTIYAIADGATTLANARSSLVQQTYVRGASAALDTLGGGAVDLSTQRGWFIDLPGGEQLNTRPTIAYGGLAFVSNVNGATDCSASSYLYLVDVLSGKKLAGTDFIATLISDMSNSSGVTALSTTGVPGQIVGAGQDADGEAWTRELIKGGTILPGKNSWIEIRR